MAYLHKSNGIIQYRRKSKRVEPLLHDNTAVLLQFAQQTRQHLLDHLRKLVLILFVLLLMAAMLPTVLSTVRRPRVPRLAAIVCAARGHISGSQRLPSLEIYVDAAGIVLGAVPQAQLAAQRLDLGLESLDVAGRVVAFADNGVQVCLAAFLIGADALLEDALGFLHELAMQVDSVAIDLAGRVVLAEDVLGGLPVVVIHPGIVGLALVRELLGGRAISVLVGALRLCFARTVSAFLF